MNDHILPLQYQSVVN